MPVDTTMTYTSCMHDQLVIVCNLVHVQREIPMNIFEIHLNSNGIKYYHDYVTLTLQIVEVIGNCQLLKEHLESITTIFFAVFVAVLSLSTFVLFFAQQLELCLLPVNLIVQTKVTEYIFTVASCRAV